MRIGEKRNLTIAMPYLMVLPDPLAGESRNTTGVYISSDITLW